MRSVRAVRDMHKRTKRLQTKNSMKTKCVHRKWKYFTAVRVVINHWNELSHKFSDLFACCQHRRAPRTYVNIIQYLASLMVAKLEVLSCQQY